MAKKKSPFRRGIGIILLALLIGAAGLMSRQMSVSRSNELVNAASFQLETGLYDSALRLSILAARSNWLQPSSATAAPMLARSFLSGPQVLGRHDLPITDAVFLREEGLFATGSLDGTIRAWDVSTGLAVWTIELDAPVRAIDIAPGGNVLAAGAEDGTTRLWNISTGGEIRRLEGHEAPIFGVEFSPDGRLLVSGSRDGAARLWNIQSGNQIAEYRVEGAGLYDVAFSPDGGRIITAADDATARIWDIETGTILVALVGHSQAVLSVAFGADGRRVITGSADHSAKIWDASLGLELMHFDAHSGLVSSVQFGGGGEWALTGSSDATARIWDVSTGTLRETLRHDAVVWAVAVSENGRQVLTGSIDSVARLWAIDPDGRTSSRSVSELQVADALIGDLAETNLSDLDDPATVAGIVRLIERACTERLISQDIGMIDDEQMDIPSGRRVTLMDIAVAPTLRSSLGRDVCAE